MWGEHPRSGARNGRSGSRFSVVQSSARLPARLHVRPPARPSAYPSAERSAGPDRAAYSPAAGLPPFVRAGVAPQTSPRASSRREMAAVTAISPPPQDGTARGDVGEAARHPHPSNFPQAVTLRYSLFLFVRDQRHRSTKRRHRLDTPPLAAPRPPLRPGRPSPSSKLPVLATVWTGYVSMVRSSGKRRHDTRVHNVGQVEPPSLLVSD